MVKRYWAAAANDIETNPCLVEGWVPVHLSSDYDALVAHMAQTDEGWKSCTSGLRETMRMLDKAEARIRDLEAAIARAKAIDPYTGIGATGAALSDSDASSKYCYMYRDAIHDALEATPSETLPEFDPAWVCGVCGKRHGPGQCLGAETGVAK